jgi:hypothetical protein
MASVPVSGPDAPKPLTGTEAIPVERRFLDGKLPRWGSSRKAPGIP